MESIKVILDYGADGATRGAGEEGVAGEVAADLLRESRKLFTAGADESSMAVLAPPPKLSR